MSASFLEIYNESLRDLLTSSSGSNGSSTVSHDIKIDPERPGHVYVTNLTPVPVTSEKQVGIYSASKYMDLSIFLPNSDHKISKNLILKTEGNIIIILYGALCKILKMYAKY